MAIPLVLIVLPLGLLFLLSGLIVNTIQAVLFYSIRPLSKRLYRRINRFLAELLWLQLIWLVDWWAGVKIQLHADPETYQLMGKEHALIISNHQSDIDWLIGWILAQRSGCLGSTLAIMKKSSKLLPGLVSAVSIMRDFVPAIYDTTVIIPKDSPEPTMLRILQGQSSVVHVCIKRHAMSDMPSSDEDVLKWCNCAKTSS